MRTMADALNMRSNIRFSGRVVDKVVVEMLRRTAQLWPFLLQGRSHGFR